MNLQWLLPVGGGRAPAMVHVSRSLAVLPKDKAWKIEAKEVKRTRSLEQNAYLWGCVYQTILTQGGEALAGWSADDLHEYFLGEHFGWETLEGFGKKRIKPVRRSSRLSTTEFSDYVDFIQRKAAELGVYIPDPGEGM